MDGQEMWSAVLPKRGYVTSIFHTHLPVEMGRGVYQTILGSRHYQGKVVNTEGLGLDQNGIDGYRVTCHMYPQEEGARITLPPYVLEEPELLPPLSATHEPVKGKKRTRTSAKSANPEWQALVAEIAGREVTEEEAQRFLENLAAAKRKKVGELNIKSITRQLQKEKLEGDFDKFRSVLSDLLYVEEAYPPVITLEELDRANKQEEAEEERRLQRERSRITRLLRLFGF